MPRTKEQDRIYLKAYRAANLEKVRAQVRARMRRWTATHREDSRAKSRRYYHANCEARKAKTRDRYQNDLDKWRAWFQAWRAKNRDKVGAAAKAWKAKHPEAAKLHRLSRRARVAGLKRERIDPAVLYARQKARCPWCRKPLSFSGATLDHIVPIAAGALAGASHTYPNLQLLHFSCNAAKGARFGAGVQPYLELAL